MTYLDIARRGKNDLWRYIVTWPVAGLVYVLILTVIIVPAVLLHWVDMGFVEKMKSAADPVPFYAGVALSFIPILLAVIVAVRWLHGKRFGDIIGAWRWRDFAFGAGVWLVLLLVSTGVDFALRPHGFRLTIGTLTPAIVALIVVVLTLQTFTEEFVFRGYLTQAVLLATKNPWVTSVITGLLFGALHIPNGIPQAVGAAAFGIFMARIAIHTGSLALGYGIHLINNLFGGVVVVSTDDILHGSPGVLSQHTPELMWVDTGFELAALVLVTFIVLRRKRAE